MEIEFEWDANKANTNQKKHAVTFEEVSTVFGDSLAVIFDDEQHSGEEQREIIIGRSDRNRILLVSFTEREDRIRIISARQASKRERTSNEENSH